MSDSPRTWEEGFFRRAFRDTVAFATSLRFILATLVLDSVAVLLAYKVTPDDLGSDADNQVLVGVLAVVGGSLTSLLLAFVWSLARAPFRQRDEGRAWRNDVIAAREPGELWTAEDLCPSLHDLSEEGERLLERIETQQEPVIDLYAAVQDWQVRTDRLLQHAPEIIRQYFGTTELQTALPDLTNDALGMFMGGKVLRLLSIYETQCSAPEADP